MPKYNTPIITIHGFKGSVLSNPDGKPAWLTMSNAVGITTPDLALPLTWKDGVQDRDDLSPSHTLKKIGYLPRFLGGDIYESWLRKAESIGPSFEFVWDWRRSLTEAILRFEAYVRWVAVKTDSRVQVVAHSAGCLITLAVMNKHPELFHSVLFAAPPFKPNINGYLRIHYGDVAGRNTKILQTEVAFTFPSALILLPTVEEYSDPDVGFIVNSRGERVIIDFFNPLDWISHGLGLAAYTNLNTQEMDHLTLGLKDALLAKKACQFKDGVDYPPIAILASKAYPTQHYAVKDGPLSKYGFDIDTPQKVPGDGSVPWSAAVNIKSGVGHIVYESTLEHHKILNDPQVVEIIDKLHSQRNNDGMTVIKFPGAKL